MVVKKYLFVQSQNAKLLIVAVLATGSKYTGWGS